jgi:predicted site-specific integrase-resolvase
MKLSKYARKVGVTYKTAWRWYQAGRISGYQMDTGTIIITESDETPVPLKVVVYARVSSSESWNNLETQAQRLVEYCTANGWQVNQVVKEIGSGVNDNRKRFLQYLRQLCGKIMRLGSTYAAKAG